MKTKTLQGVSFMIAEGGMVSTPDYSDIGNIEDCREFAALVWHVFDTLQSDPIN